MKVVAKVTLSTEYEVTENLGGEWTLDKIKRDVDRSLQSISVHIGQGTLPPKQVKATYKLDNIKIITNDK